MKRFPLHTLLLVLLLPALTLQGAGFRAGTGRKAITPKEPVWLNGYAAREKPSEGASHDLWAKALVLEESPSSRYIIVTVDVLGLSKEIADQAAERIMKQYAVDRSRILLNSSHTHAAPVIWPCLSGMFELTVAEQQALSRYGHGLTDALVGSVKVGTKMVAVAAGKKAADAKTFDTLCIDANADGKWTDDECTAIEVAARPGRGRRSP